MSKTKHNLGVSYRDNPKEYVRRYAAIKREMNKDKPLPLIQRYQGLRRRTIKEGLEFTITFDQFDMYQYLPCFYCDKIFDQKAGHGLDKFEPKLGYTPANVVRCCPNCNRLKSDLVTGEEMIQIALLLRGMRNGPIWR